jgi:hypothetical protein
VIQETLSCKQNPAVTSDHWHVVHARWTGEAGHRARFVRSIESEHEDRASAITAARERFAALAETMASRSPVQRDQFFVRRPGFKSLKLAPRMARRRG